MTHPRPYAHTNGTPADPGAREARIRAIEVAARAEVEAYRLMGCDLARTLSRKGLSAHAILRHSLTLDGQTGDGSAAVASGMRETALRLMEWER